MARWPYVCGLMARAADAISGARRDCPLSPGPGGSGAYECWMAGYRGEPEPDTIVPDTVVPSVTACATAPEPISSEMHVAPAARPTLPHSMGIVVIVDVMNLLVRAWHASPPSELNGVRSFLDTVRSLIERLSPEYLLFAADGGYQHRSALLPSYKNHRPPMDEGLKRQVGITEKLLETVGWPLIRAIGYEADDVLATLATQLRDRAAGVVLVTSDKDLLQLVPSVQVYLPWGAGEFLTPAKIRDKFSIEPQQIADYLALIGDNSDGIPGVSGIGPKTAAELLGKHKTLDGILEAARVLQIPGAAGKKLREGVDQARLSRQLVNLVTDLPLSHEWLEWPLSEPRLNWVDGLKQLGLAAQAQRLTPVLNVGTSRIRPPSHIEHEWLKDFSLDVIEKQPTTQEPSDATSTESPVVQAQDREVSDGSDSPMVAQSGIAAGVVAAGREPAADPVRSAQAGTGEDRDRQSQPIGARTSVILTRTLKVKGKEDDLTKWLQVQYEGGRAAARRGRSPDSNPWKPGARREAWSRGFHNQPLDLASLIAIEQQPVAAAQSTQVLALPKPKQAALF